MNNFIELTTELGLPCIIRGDVIYVVGEKQILTFVKIDNYVLLTEEESKDE